MMMRRNSTKWTSRGEESMKNLRPANANCPGTLRWLAATKAAKGDPAVIDIDDGKAEAEASGRGWYAWAQRLLGWRAGKAGDDP